MLLLGTSDKTPQLLQAAREPFLLIANTQTANAFAKHFTDAEIFNPRRHSFAIKRDYVSVRDFADILYSSGEGANTLTVRNGKRALVRLLLDTNTPLHELDGDRKDPAIAEALATVDDLLQSPVLKRVLTRTPNFTFEGCVIAKLDGLHPTDAQILAALLIGQSKGQVIVPEFGFYGRPLHLSLIRDGRLVAGLNTLSEAPLSLRHALLTIPQKHGAGCVHEDALVLAQYAGLTPGQVNHTEFVQSLTLPPAPEGR